MWILYAILAALSASLIPIFGKFGTSLKDVAPAMFGNHPWISIALSGLAGVVSWVFYLLALKEGDATAVASIDRLSIVFVFLFAIIFLGDAFTWRACIGVFLVALGTIIVTVR